MLGSIMVMGQATALATSCVCMSVGVSSALPSPPPTFIILSMKVEHFTGMEMTKTHKDAMI